MSDNFAMSGSDFEEKTYSKIRNFKFEQGNNVFRVLPALWSAAKDPRKPYSKYWKTHWGLTDLEGKKLPVVCTERKNSNKEVTEHCPICDELARRQAFVDLKKGQVPEEQLEEIVATRIDPFKSKGYYFAWAIDLKGDVGLLQMPKTVHDEFFTLGRETKDARGVVLNGMTGAYINVKKVGKGKFGTKYSVVLYRDPKTDQPVMHEISEELVNKIKVETRDLNSLYTALPVEDVTKIASLLGKPELPGFISELKARRRSRQAAVQDDSKVGTTMSFESDDIDPVDLARNAVPEVREALDKPQPVTAPSSDDFDALFEKSFPKQ